MAAAMWVGDSGVSLRRHINPFTCRPNFRRPDDKPVHCCPAPSAGYWPRFSLTISCGAPVHRTCVRGCEGMGVRGGGGGDFGGLAVLHTPSTKTHPPKGADIAIHTPGMRRTR